LKQYRSNGTVQPPQPTVAIETEGHTLVWTVDRIIAHEQRNLRNRTLTPYFVKWTGHGTENNSWIEESALLDRTLIDAYWATRSEDASPEGGGADVAA